MEHPTETPGRRLPCSRLAACALMVGAACAAILLAGSPGVPMVWDEGSSIVRAESIRQWFASWASNAELADGPPPLSDEAITRQWRYTTQIEGHPALSGLVIAMGQTLGQRWLTPLSAARLGPIVLFGLAAGAMFFRMARQFSFVAAVAAVTALLLLPRVFAHLHFASYDGPLASCWLLAWAAFDPARRRWGWAVALGIALGMTMSVKATGWIAPMPFLVWAVCRRDRPALKALTLALPVAVATFTLLNPPLWHHPIDGIAVFFRLNLGRAEEGWNIPVQFLGQIYHLGHPLPWYNTLFWTAVTVPVPLLVLFVVGVATVLRRADWRAPGMLLLVNWFALILVRALPGTPPHDGVRMFLPSFVFLAALVGVGAASVGRHSLTSSHWCRGWRAWVVVVVAYAAAATSVVWYWPHGLSYYNLLLGGVRGAVACGMEPTYYWDGLDASLLEWLNRNTPEDEKIRFAAGPSQNLELMRRWGLLRREFRPDAPQALRWYVVQHRPSAHDPADRWLLAHGRAAYRKMLGRGGRGPWRRDVPLVEVYPYEEHVRAVRSAPD